MRSDEWETPQDLYDQLDREFRFDLDPCSTDENHKTPWYYTKDQDGLKQSWGGAKSMVQSPVFQHQELGAEGVPGGNAAGDRGGHAAAGIHGHAVVLGLRLRSVGGPVPPWTGAVLRVEIQCAFRVHDRDLQSCGNVRRTT